MKNLPILLILGCILSLTSCMHEDIDDNGVAVKDIIFNGTELFNYVERVSTEDQENAVTCVQFVYPIAVYALDSNDNITGLVNISDNQVFFNFLSNLTPSENISITYPIETILADGTVVSINNNDELLQSIEQCIDEQLQIIGQCDALLASCIWEVGYSFNDTNEFLGAEFDGSGQTYFTYDEDIHTGSWNALYIENQLFININLINAGNYSQRFNFNWRVEEWNNEQMILTNDNSEVVLNRYCSPDDSNLCFNLDFEECEDPQDPGFADFILSDYDSCIIEIMRLDDTINTWAFYETEVDADNETNPIDATTAYRNNTAFSQDLYVRIEYPNDLVNPYRVIRISINTAVCP